MSPHGPRDPTAGPDSGPAPPYPLRLSGKVIKGFGRGSADLDIRTANIPIEGLTVGGHKHLENGVYFGWAGLDFVSKNADLTSSGERGDRKGWEGHGRVHPMVMSIGWNPFYKNEKRSVEVHIMHKFSHDFYGAHMNLVILGFIRPEYDYVSMQALIDDINTDIEVTRRSLERPSYQEFMYDPYLLTFPDGGGDESKGDVAS